jgi:uncharacterized phage protein gp47/JayE
VNTPRKDAARAGGFIRFSGTNGSFIAVGTIVAVAQVDPTADEVTFETIESGTISGGYVDLEVLAVDAGSSGNVETDTVTILVSPVAGVTSVTNPSPLSGGEEIETDEAYRERILLAYAGVHGGGTIDDYRSWALAYPGVGFATVEPVWAGAGTVRVIITDVNNNPVSAGVVAGLQAQLDPIAGQGRGLAPIGATVTVATPTLKTVNVVSDVTLLTGYSLDGAGGTENLTDRHRRVDSAAYVERPRAGRRRDLEATSLRRSSRSSASYDVVTLTLNGGATNVAVASLEVANLGSVSLS